MIGPGARGFWGLINSWKSQHSAGDIKAKMVNNTMHVRCNSVDYIKSVCVTSHVPSLCISLGFFSSLLILSLDFFPFHYLLSFVMFGSFAENKGWSFDWHAQRWPNVILYMDHWFCPTKIPLSLSQPQTALVQQIHTQIHMYTENKTKKKPYRHTKQTFCKHMHTTAIP